MGDARSGPAETTAGSDAAPADAGESTDEARYGRNGWIYCASIAPATPAERSAWREAMPPGYDAVSPIRRPRAFARALGAMAAEQAGPRGRTVLLRNTVDGEAFSTAHRSQTVYHGPVVYSDDPYWRLERASSELELRLLLVFLKDAAHRAQREYRLVVWAEKEPREDRLDLPVSPALLEAMQAPPLDPDGGGFVPAGVEESSTVEAIHDDGHPRATLYVEALPAFPTSSNLTVARGATTSSRCRAICGRRRWSMRLPRRCGRRSANWMRSRAATPPPRRGTPSGSCGSSARPTAAASPGCA